MNIIALFEKLELDKSKIRSFSAEDIIRIEKQLNVERRLNPDIDTNSANNLIDALRNYSDAFAFVAGKRVLYNFFSGKNHSRNAFNFTTYDVYPQIMRDFFGRYLQEDLLLKADRGLSDEKFDDLEEVLSFKEYISEDALFKIQKRLFGKIDFALRILNQPPIAESSIEFITYGSFYRLMNRFSSIEADEKINGLVNVIARMYNTTGKKAYAKTILISMSAYTPFDEELEAVLSKNRAIMLRANAGSSSSSTIPWFRIVIFILIFVRAGLQVNRCSSSSTNSYTPANNDQQYEEIMKVQGQIDANRETLKNGRALSNENVEYFYNYLTNYETSELKTDKMPYTEIANGSNPFQYFYKQRTGGVSNGNELKNSSKYDLVLFENQEINGVTIPVNAYFVKAKTAIQFADKNKTYPMSYNFYFGNDISVFGARTIQWHGAPRFINQPGNAREKTRRTFLIQNDITITDKGDSQLIKSHSLTCKSDPKAVNVEEYLLK